ASSSPPSISVTRTSAPNALMAAISAARSRFQGPVAAWSCRLPGHRVIPMRPPPGTSTDGISRGWVMLVLTAAVLMDSRRPGRRQAHAFVVQVIPANPVILQKGCALGQLAVPLPECRNVKLGALHQLV